MKKLKNLIIKKVDLEKEGANPDAYVNLFKTKKTDETEIVQKDAETFSDQLREKAVWEICDQIWQYTNALSNSLSSILRDEDTEDKAAMMKKSLDEFYGAAGLAIDKWSAGKVSEYIVAPDDGDNTAVAEVIKSLTVKSMKGEITDDVVGKLTAALDDMTVSKTKNEGGNENMKFEDIDTSALTAEEVEQLEAIAKKAGVKPPKKDDEGDNPPPADDNKGKDNGDEEPEKKSDKPVKKSKGDPEDDEDIYKGIHPAVAKEMAELRKFRENAEHRELVTKAKKYEILGKDPEELAKTLKTLKDAGGTAYDDMISVLDTSYEMVTKSGAFDEVGRSGHGAVATVAKAKVQSAAEQIMKSNPGMTEEKAILKAVTENPALYDEYLKEGN